MSAVVAIVLMTSTLMSCSNHHEASLVGGTRLVLVPQTVGSDLVTTEKITESIQTIKHRLDGAKLAGAQVFAQGLHQIVVLLPRTPSPGTLNLVRAQGQLRFRPVLAVASEQPGTLSGSGAAVAPRTPVGGSAPAPTNASDLVWAHQLVPGTGMTWAQRFQKASCEDPKSVSTETETDNLPFVTCASDAKEKYLLGPAELLETDIKNASARPETNSQGQIVGADWQIDLTFTPAGAKRFAAATTRLAALTGDQNRFAIELDTLVISAPSVQEAITGGQAQISGVFTPDEATTIANQLTAGSLPLKFQIQSQESITATPQGP